MNWDPFIKFLGKVVCSVICAVVFTIVGFVIGIAFSWLNNQPRYNGEDV